MTYEEAGRVLGIDPDSVSRRARRLKWPRQPGNDGRARVAVPPDALPQSAPASGQDKILVSRADDALDNPGDRGGHIPPDESRAINALEAAAAALHERAARAEAERDMAQAAASTERARAVQAETEREVARIAAARAEGEAAALK